MFGGLTYGLVTLDDLWSFSGGAWQPLQGASGCGPPTCPPARFYPGFAYDLNDHEAVLFGGLNLTASGLVPLNDTWVYANGAWTNITSTAGSAPSPRYEMAMTYASSEGYVLLFGGANLSGTYFGDTWTFTHGRWTNLSASLAQAPSSRAGAAIADSPTGYTLLYGGADSVGLITINPSGSPCPAPMWWFSGGAWTYASYGCVASPPSPNTGSQGPYGPCGRTGAMLSWSPRNHLFVLFGGQGYANTAGACPTSGTVVALNDTWDYLGSPGGTYVNWASDPAPTALSDRYLGAYAPDYADGYALDFGGVTASGSLPSDTWRYYAVVSASLVGPANLTANAFGFWGQGVFRLRAFGGSDQLNYIFNTTLLQTTHPLAGNGSCSNFTSHQGAVVPAAHTQVFLCSPFATSYNLYRLSVSVWDSQNATQRAYANWTFSVSPPESLRVLSEFKGYFYEGFSLPNYFGIYAQISGLPVTSIVATLEGQYVTFSHTNSSNDWWNGSFDMGQLGPGAVLEVSASATDWTETTNLSFQVAAIPPFLEQLAALSGAITSTTVTGTGSFGHAYKLTQSIPLPIGKLFNFSIPIPLISGNYSLVPDIQLKFSEASSGNLSISGVFNLATPSISLGTFNLKITVSLSLTGNLALQPDHGNLSVTWVSATLQIGINADFGANIPIWGFKFDIFGYNCSIGFNIDIDINPSFALSIFMTPSTSAANDMLQGVDLMVSQVYGELSLPIQVTANFGFVVGEVSAGGKLSFDVTFQVTPGQFEANNLWINGSVFAKLTILFWSGTWNILGPGVIYHWVPTPLAPTGGALPSSYDNGHDATWSTDPRAYNTTGFDHIVWSALASAGTAVSDIYPEASPSSAGAYNGAYLFYTDDRVSLPVRSGLTVSGLRLDPSANTVGSVSMPSDPGFLTARPVAATLPDGSVYVLWTALPVSDAAAATPAGISALLLHGARFYPSNGSWSPVQRFTSNGFAYSYAIDPTASTPELATLLAPTLLPTPSTPERLVTLDLSSGAVRTNASVSGVSHLSSFRASLGEAAVQLQSGNYTVVRLTDGSVQSLASAGAPTNGSLNGATFVPGAASTLLLWYRTPSAGEAILFNASSAQAVAEVPLAGDVRDVEGFCGGANCSVYASNRSGVFGWSIAPTGAVAPLPGAPVGSVASFGLVPVGHALVVYAVVPEGNGSSGLRDLYLAEFSSVLPPITVGSPSGSTGGSGGGPSTSAPFDALVYLGLPIAAAVGVLAISAIRRMRGRRPKTSSSSGAAAGAELGHDEPAKGRGG